MMLQLHDVNLSYTSNPNDDVLQDINLSISKGELVTVVGPSGCGKSSLLKLAAGVLLPSSGIVTFKDKKLNGFNKKIGMMFQNPSLYPWLNVMDNIVFSLKMRKIPKEKRYQLGYGYLNKLNLIEYEDYYPFELSGGMKQRVSLARTLIYNPELVLMDEPFAALDAFTKKQMQDLLIQLWETTGSTIVFVTHDLLEAIKLGTRLIVMSTKPGRIIQDIALNDSDKIKRLLEKYQVESLESLVYQTLSNDSF